MSEAVDLFTQQELNRRRSRRLVAGFVLFFAWLGFGGDWLLWQFTMGAGEDAYRHVFPWAGVGLSALAIGMVWWTRRTGADSVLAAAGATELVAPRAPHEVELFNVVEEMAVASGLPRPRIYLIRDPDPNAFVTGLDPSDARLAVTEGLLPLLDRDELQAVVGHELGHVKNEDVRLMTTLAGLVGTIALVNDVLGRNVRHGRLPLPGGGRSRKGSNLGPLVIVVLVLWLVSWILAPLVCRLLALGVSRKREYLADAMAAQFTRNPAALASALDKIERAAAPTQSVGRAAAHLCIADPLGRGMNLRQGWLADLLGTHPPMALRVARLRAMAYQERKRSGTPAAVA